MSVSLDVLLIGCGQIAGGYDAADPTGPYVRTHAKAFRQHGGFRLAGCVDADRARAEAFAACWGVMHVYDSLDQALLARDFDVISLCAPTCDHAALLRRIADHPPRLLFCEKPITDQLDSAQAMAALYQGRMTVNYLRRFVPEIRVLAADIAGYGRLLSGQLRYGKGLYNNGSHMIDLLHFLLGPVTVLASGAVIHDFWPDDPTVSATLEVAGACLDLTGCDQRTGMVFDLVLDFEQARVSLSDFSRGLTVQKNAAPAQSRPTALDRAMLYGTINIHDHLVNGGPLYVSAADGVAALAVCTAIRAKAGLA